MSLTDKIFGRSELKKRIKELEERIEALNKEKKHLEEKTEKERKRAKEAVSEKQELDEKINRQKDRIESLEDKLRKKEYAEKAIGEKTQPNRLSRDKLRSLLEKLESVESKEEDIFTVFFPPGASMEDLASRSALQTNLTMNQLKKIKEESSETGKVLFYSENFISLMIKPPIPIEREDWNRSKTFEVSDLMKQLDSTMGFIFLSAGGSALSVFGEDVQESRFVKGEIKSKHGKGGFSQGRFERKRGEEVKAHLDNIEGAAKEFFPENLEIVALSGSKRMVKKFEKESDLKGTIFEKKMDLSKIQDEEDIAKAFRTFWQSQIIKI